LFAIRKVGQRKTHFSQRKIWLGFQESVFLENLNEKHFLKVVKNLEMSLFADYIKFGPQTFDCYI
jgi:CRISPR/Cas system-associated endoribonuclease Cas2